MTTSTSSPKVSAESKSKTSSLKDLKPTSFQRSLSQVIILVRSRCCTTAREARLYQLRDLTIWPAPRLAEPITTNYSRFTQWWTTWWRSTPSSTTIQSSSSSRCRWTRLISLKACLQRLKLSGSTTCSSDSLRREPWSTNLILFQKKCTLSKVAKSTSFNTLTMKAPRSILLSKSCLEDPWSTTILSWWRMVLILMLSASHPWVCSIFTSTLSIECVKSITIWTKPWKEKRCS